MGGGETTKLGHTVKISSKENLAFAPIITEPKAFLISLMKL